MIHVSDQEFAELIAQSLDEMPAEHMAAVKNVAIIYTDEPTAEQREQLRLRDDQTLFGLYEGVPLPARNGGTGYPPDKITIFKQPLIAFVHDMAELKRQVKHTVWHELAHYFGLDHDRIYELEDKE